MAKFKSIRVGHILEYHILGFDFGEDYLEGAPRKTRVKVGKLDQLK